MVEGQTVGQLIEYCEEEYNRELNSQEASRELRRLYQKGILDREDKFGNGSVYFYKLKTD